MSKGILALGLAGAILACGGGGGFDGILRKARSFKDQVCACKDQACVDGVHAAMLVAFGDDQNFKAKPSRDQRRAWEAVRAEARTCERAIEDADGVAAAAVTITRLKASRDKLCACPDMACADVVADEVMRAVGELAGTDLADAQRTAYLAINDEVQACIAKLKPVDPAAPPAPPAP